MKRSQSPITILLADDDDDDRDLFIEALKEAKIAATLITVSNGPKLMQHLNDKNKSAPDVVFLDVRLPCKSGKECLFEIRCNPELDAIPVIMFSGSEYLADIWETFAEGANRYVRKPCSFETHVLILKELFAAGWRQRLNDRNRETFVWQLPAYFAATG